MLGNALALYKKVETKKLYLPVAAIPIGFTVKFINTIRFVVETNDRSLLYAGIEWELGGIEIKLYLINVA